MAGAETVQLYLHEIKKSIDRPEKELKGFKRIFLKPGESKTVSIPVNARDLAYWSEEEHQWKISAGKYLVELGSSSKRYPSANYC